MLTSDELTISPSDEPAILSLTDAINPHVKRAIEYWNGLRGERCFPARGELTLRGMAAILPYCVIVSVVDSGADYEYRYVGEEQRQAYGIQFKGLRLSKIEAAAPQLGMLLRGAYETVRAHGQPFVVRGRLASGSKDTALLYHESVFLPLGAAAVDHILIVGVRVPRPFWEIPSNHLKVLAEKARA
jgi:hypothetical protein